MEKEINLYSLTCPNCGANLEVDDGLLTYVCPYCETKILLKGLSNGELEAKVDMAELEFRKYELRQKALEKERDYQRKRRDEIEDAHPTVIGFIAFIVIFALIGSILYFSGAIGEVKAPYSSAELIKMDHSEAYQTLKKAGFMKIEENPIKGTPGFFSKSDIISISIDGKTSFKAGKTFPKRAVVIITYYAG